MMTARRQPSATSLSQYMRAGSPANIGRSTDFCNSFWGVGDKGVDVLFARMRGALRTMEELKNFWKERAAIEEDYAKRLGKLAKQTLGKDEIGELRNSLDTVRLETDKQSTFHLSVAQSIKTDLENTAAAFLAKQTHHKKVYQGAIEKEFKNKQAQESHVKKAREKYEQDCMRINSYTAQSTLVQGRDLEKIQMKLERAHAGVQTNERDFANFARAFADTAVRWEQEWKIFCDSCQDLEDARMEFMKDNIWAYANAVSTVCVSDDESCEKIRVALESMDSEKEMENFVRDYGSGPQIPAPPAFFTYNSPEAASATSARTKIANFVRSSQRSSPLRMPTAIPPEEDQQPQQQQREEEEAQVNVAGRGAGGGGAHSAKNSVSDARPSSRAANGINGVNGSLHSPSGSSSGAQQSQPQQALSRKSTRSSYRHPPPVADPDPLAETIDPTAETYIKVGGNAYKVDLNNDPQRRQPTSTSMGGYAASSSSSPTKSRSNTANSLADDPLAKQLEELQNQVSHSGTVRRNSVWRGGSGADSSAGAGASSRRGTMDSLAAPGSAGPGAGVRSSSSSSSSRDYRNSAEVVVGAYPGHAHSHSLSASRPASPSPPGPAAPTAAFMVPKKPVSPGAEMIDGVLTDYHQSLPGERKSVSISRSGSRSRRGSYAGSTYSLNTVDQQQTGNNLNRPPSVGHAGVGAHGGGSRSASPQPISRSTSPAPSPGQLMSPPPGGMSVVRAGSTHQIQQRSPSPNPLGIALDANNARVTVDEMALRYQQQQQQQQVQQPAAPQQIQHVPPPPPQSQSPYRPPQQQQQVAIQPQQQQPTYHNPRAPSYSAPGAQPPYAPPPAPTAAPVYQQHPHQQQQVQLGYVPPPPVQQPPQQHQQQHSLSHYQPQAQQMYQSPGTPSPAYAQNAHVDRAYYGNGVQMQQQQAQQQQHQQQQRSMHQQASSGGYGQGQGQGQGMYRRSPSPQPGAMVAAPTRQVTEDGAGILFYVQALYDYSATIDEEFDFQAGDVIAVTATPEDGWWSGQLLDENRRQHGRHVFPSNFVRLF